MISESATILIVEDEQDIRELLAYNLEKEGYATVQAADGKEGLDLARSRKPDLILLDLMLPKMDGLAVCRELERDAGTVRIPIIMLTARGEDVDRILGFELGADDYVVKPFDPRELLARIRTVLRRASDKGQPAAQSDMRRFAGWSLNVRSRELSQGDERIALSDAMYRLLLVFLDEPFAVLSREYLLRQTQGRDADVFDRSVDIQVSRLRGLLKDTGASRIIKTVRGGGYMLSVDVEHDA